MRDNSGNGVLVGAVVLIVLLLLAVGAGFFADTPLHQAELVTRADNTRVEEARARVDAEQARAAATAALELQHDAGDHGPASEQADTIRTDIEAVFRAQQEAWNRSDVEAFMEHYWKSDDLTFSSGGKTTRGWNATLARYRERYPTPGAMGKLTLSDLEITSLGDSAALVLGQWKLDRETEPVGGNYSIIFRKIDGRWLIIHDHTSRRAE